MHHDQPRPPRTAHRDDSGRDDCPPREVQRRHGRQLVRRRVGDILAVDAGAVHVQLVDEPLVAQHPRWREWEQHVNDQTGQGDRQEPRADASPCLRVAQEHPRHEAEAGREVHEHVVVIEELDGRPAVQDQTLQRTLAERPKPALDAHDPVGIHHCVVHVAAGQRTHLAIQREHGGHQNDLAHCRASETVGPPGGAAPGDLAPRVLAWCRRVGSWCCDDVRHGVGPWGSTPVMHSL